MTMACELDVGISEGMEEVLHLQRWLQPLPPLLLGRIAVAVMAAMLCGKPAITHCSCCCLARRLGKPHPMGLRSTTATTHVPMPCYTWWSIISNKKNINVEFRFWNS